MASNDDVEGAARRNRRRVRVRKAATTTGMTSTATSDADDGVIDRNDCGDPPAGNGAPGLETAGHEGSRDCPIRRKINVNVGDADLLTATRDVDGADAVRVNGNADVRSSTGADETDTTAVDVVSQPPQNDLPAGAHAGDAPTKSRGKRKVKVKGRKAVASAAEMVNETEKTQSLSTDGGADDWFAAVRNADVTSVRRMARSKSVNVNATDDQGNTALHIAALTKNAELIDVLASIRGVDVNQRNSNGETALYTSARAVDTATASRLLAAGADVNETRPDDGSTPLHCACQDGDGSVLVSVLLNAGARPDVGRQSARSGVSGITPLHDAADVGDAQSVATLLRHDETLADAVTDRGCTALHVAARHGYRDIVDQLLAHNAYVGQPGADSRGLGVQPLHLAAENGRVDAVRSLLAVGADTNARREFCGKTGVSSLHLAVMRGQVDAVKVLLESGTDVDAADEDGATSLHVAARGGVADAARLLLQHGAAVDVVTCQPRVRRHGGRSSDGLTVGRAFAQTPLHFAVRYRHLYVATVLIAAGSDVNAAEQTFVDEIVLRRRNSQPQGEEPVPLTSTFKNAPAVTSMATTAAAVPSQLVSGYTALHWAVENDDRDAVRLLLEAGADVNRAAAFDAHAGVTPLHLAAQDGRSDVAADLLHHGATRDPRKRTRNRENITPLHQAVYNSHPTTVAVLLASGCDPNVQADNGYAAVHYAAQKGSVEMTRSILDTEGCDVALRASTREQQDITALHLAVQSDSVELVVALASAGAPVDAGKSMGGGVSGVTPLHQAVYQEKEEIVEALLELGADPARSMDGWYTPLHVAAEKGCVAIARRLLEAIADGGGERAVDATASLGEHVDLTPLHVAAQHGHREMITLLVDAGADTRSVRGFGDRGSITALHLAAENGFVDAVVELLGTAKSADSSLVNAQDSLGFTALHLAVQYLFPNVVRALVDAGVDVSLRTNDGLTAWRIADQINDDSILQILGPPTSAMRANELVSIIQPAEKRKSSKARGLLCGMNKR